MPIEFAPPSAQVQPFQITPTQYTDPLETLARMQQLKTQGIQQQNAQLQLQQAQMQMDSNKAMLGAFVSGAGDPDKTLQLMTQSGKVLPNDILGFQNHMTDYKTKIAVLRKDQQEIYKQDADTLAGLYQGVDSQDALNAANAKADAQGITAQVPRITTYPGDPDHMKAAANSIGMLSQITDRTLKGAQIAQEQAGTAEKQATTKKVGLETTGLLKNQLISDINTAPKDPNNPLLPSTEAWPGIRDNPAYKDLNLPPRPTTQYIKDLRTSTIPEKERPEYEIKAAQADAIKAFSTMTPQQLDAQVDAIMPPSDPMNAPTKALIRTKASQGDFPGVQAILKDAYDQRGRVQVAKETAQNKLSIDLSGYARQLEGGPGGGGAGTDLHGEEYLKTLSPALAAQVRNIATGGDVLPTRMTGPSILLKNAVYQYDPNYTPLLAEKRKETLKEFTNTNIQHAGGQSLALNTLIHHADLYMQTGEALKNGTFRPGNAVYNAVASAFGSAPPTQADLVARFFAGETGKVATGGVPGEGEVNGILKNLTNANSPQQITDAGKTLLGIAAGRMVPLKERIADAKLEGLAPPVLGSSAREILQRRGFDPETMKPLQAGLPWETIAVPMKDGRIVFFPPDAAAKFKKDHPELVK